MSDTSASNKRIAKNTLMLYVRMLFTMAVSLFTSRVVLQTLGVEDYGIYNVVGGVITMFTFINGAMVSSTQRYLNFELATGNAERLRSVFNTSMQIHALIALVIILLGETVGLWFLMNKLVIPASRMVAAMWVYQCSILSCAVGILSTPYNADIIAHEKMSAFAYISILDVCLKLLIVYLLVISPFDKLIVYALLILSIQLLIRYIYSRYCNNHFKETLLEWRVNRPLLKEMAGFAGWSFWGNLAVILYTQGLNMMLNIFFGPIVNAARAVAVQVQSAIQQFVGNFQMALNPQITKTYAKGELDVMHSLMFRSGRFSFYLLFFLALPVLFETEFILTVWLKTVPEHTVTFLRIMLCSSLIYTCANPMVIANQATGRVKKYQAVCGGILLLILPISYLLLRLGMPAYSVFLVHFCMECVCQLARMMMLRPLIGLRLKDYFLNMYLRIAIVVAASVVAPALVYFSMSGGLIRFLVLGLTCIISVSASAYFLGLFPNERMFIRSKVVSMCNRFNIE